MYHPSPHASWCREAEVLNNSERSLCLPLCGGAGGSALALALDTISRRSKRQELTHVVSTFYYNIFHVVKDGILQEKGARSRKTGE